MLVKRNLVLKVRDRAQLIILLLQAPLFAVLIALVYNVIKEPAERSQSKLPQTAQAFAEMGANIVGLEFLMIVAAIWFGCNNAARDIVGEWTVFQRERMVNLKLPSYVFSKFAVLLGLCVFQCLTLLTIVYFACQLKGNYLQTAAVLVTSSLVGAALGLAISARSKYHRERHRIAAGRTAAGYRSGRRNSRHLQDAGPRTVAELCSAVALGL